MPRAFDWLLIACGSVVAIACTAESFRRLGASTRVEVGMGSSAGTFSRKGGRTWDTEEDALYAAVSWDLLPWLAGGLERERDERQTAALAKALAAICEPDRIPFEQSPPDPLPLPGGGGDVDVDGKGPAAPPPPWYASPEFIVTASTALAAALGVWQRKNIGQGVQHIKKAVTRKKKPPE